MIIFPVKKIFFSVCKQTWYMFVCTLKICWPCKLMSVYCLCCFFCCFFSPRLTPHRRPSCPALTSTHTAPTRWCCQRPSLSSARLSSTKSGTSGWRIEEQRRSPHVSRRAFTLTAKSRLYLHTRDMSPSPTTRSPWWICDDFLWNLFIFFHKNTHRLFYQTADIVLEKTLILFSGQYWAKCRPQVYHSHGLQLFSKGTTLWTFFFL